MHFSKDQTTPEPHPTFPEQSLYDPINHPILYGPLKNMTGITYFTTPNKILSQADRIDRIKIFNRFWTSIYAYWCFTYIIIINIIIFSHPQSYLRNTPSWILCTYVRVYVCKSSLQYIYITNHCWMKVSPKYFG